MDIQTIDNQYNQLQSQAQQTVASLQALAQKLQSAAQTGDQNAREWVLDLKGIALAIQAEQNQVTNLLQALHMFVANQSQQATQSPWGNTSPSYPAPQAASAGYPRQSGGILGGFLNSGFGRALEMGAGFGIGDEIINSIF
ncbi:hypothetical protein [Acidocella sp.]|uniref:hypothetical protein n=1 Tax=Acidocella sp. TaxID=50710 RepID=UPI002633F3F7|nr:hypothetical protein [Acidocella sp.]